MINTNEIEEVVQVGKKLNLKFVSDVIGDDYKKWHSGDIVLISAQTGTGKNFFIENKIIPSLEEKKLLFISNRTNLKREVKARLLQKFNIVVPEGFEELDKITKVENITITSYHALQHSAINEEYDNEIFDLSLYEYIIMDEVHFVLTDGSFNNLNRLTDLSPKKMYEIYLGKSNKMYMEDEEMKKYS